MWKKVLISIFNFCGKPILCAVISLSQTELLFPAFYFGSTNIVVDTVLAHNEINSSDLCSK